MILYLFSDFVHPWMCAKTNILMYFEVSVILWMIVLNIRDPKSTKMQLSLFTLPSRDNENESRFCHSEIGNVPLCEEVQVYQKQVTLTSQWCHVRHKVTVAWESQWVQLKVVILVTWFLAFFIVVTEACDITMASSRLAVLYYRYWKKKHNSGIYKALM